MSLLIFLVTFALWCFWALPGEDCCYSGLVCRWRILFTPLPAFRGESFRFQLPFSFSIGKDLSFFIIVYNNKTHVPLDISIWAPMPWHTCERSEGNFVELVFSFNFYVASGSWTQVIKFLKQLPSELSHLPWDLVLSPEIKTCILSCPLTRQDSKIRAIKRWADCHWSWKARPVLP